MYKICTTIKPHWCKTFHIVHNKANMQKSSVSPKFPWKCCNIWVKVPLLCMIYMIWWQLRICSEFAQIYSDLGELCIWMSNTPNELLLYIIFIKFFSPISLTFRFRSWCLPSLCTHYSSTCYIFHIYTYFWFQVFFYCSWLLHALPFTLPHALIFISICFNSVHNLFQVTMTFYIFYDLSLLHSWFILMQYINHCIFLVVLQFVNWCWFISSFIFSLSLLSILKSLSPLSLTSSSSGNYIY